MALLNICTRYGAEGIVEQGGGREEGEREERREGEERGGREKGREERGRKEGRGVGLVSCIFFYFHRYRIFQDQFS